MVEVEQVNISILDRAYNKPDLSLLPLKGLPSIEALLPYVGRFSESEIYEFASQQMKRKVSIWRDTWLTRMLVPFFLTMLFNIIFVAVAQPDWADNSHIQAVIFNFNELFPGLYSDIFLEEDIEVARLYLTLFLIEIPLFWVITLTYIIADLTILNSRSIMQKPYFYLLDNEYISEQKKEKKTIKNLIKIVLVGLIAVSMGIAIAYFEIFVQQTGRDRFDGYASINIYFFVVITMLRDLGIALIFTIMSVYAFFGSVYEYFFFKEIENE